MGPSHDTLWESEGTPFDLQTVKILKKAQVKTVAHRNRSLPHGEVHGETHTYGDLPHRDLWVFIFFI